MLPVMENGDGLMVMVMMLVILNVIIKFQQMQICICRLSQRWLFSHSLGGFEFCDYEQFFRENLFSCLFSYHCKNKLF